MMNLNLISDEQKKEISYNLMLNSVRNSLYVVSILIVVFSGTVIYLENYLELEAEKINNEIENINASSKIFKEKVNKINGFIDFTEQLQAEYFQTSCIIKRLAENNPGITISSFNFDRSGKTVYLTGNAQTRQNLLAYHENLASREYLTVEELPLSILSVKSNIAFSISAVIDLEKFE